MKRPPEGFEKVGVVGVDAGVVMIADPCYWSDGYDWGKFCDLIGSQDATQMNFDLGHAGKGVVLSSGYGDGIYNVYAKKNAEGRTIAALILFDEEEE